MALETTFTDIDLRDVLNVAARMKDDGQRAVQVMCVNTEDGIDITYSYSKGNVVSNYRVRGVTEEDTVPSIQPLFLGVFPFENEAVDLFGVHVEGMVLDFAGHFYELSQKAPMTIISPAQKAARDKAKKQAAAKAARAAKAAGAGAPAPAGKDVPPASAAAPAATEPAPAAPAAGAAPAASGWKGKSPERIEAMIADRGLDEATAQRVREGVAKHAAPPADVPADAAPPAAAAPAAPAEPVSAPPEPPAAAGTETLSYNEPILPASVEVPSTDAVLEAFIDRMPEDQAARVRAAVKAKEERDGRPLGSQFDVPAPEPDLAKQPKKVTIEVAQGPETKPRVPAGVARPSTREVIEEHLERMDAGRAQAVRDAIAAKEAREGAPYGQDGFPPAAEKKEDTSGKDGE